MFRKDYLRLISNLALVVTILTTCVPSLAQVMSTSGKTKPFSVEICSAGTTKRIDNIIVTAKVQNQPQVPTEKESRLHNVNCPFCIADEAQLTVANYYASVIAIESKLTHHIQAYATPVARDFYQTANPSQAPPLV